MQDVSENPAYFHLEDLLPPIHYQIIEGSTGAKLLPSVRTGILVSLVNCLQTSVLRKAEGRAGRERAGAVTTLITSDHFCNAWMPRAEIVREIEGATGLRKEMADLSLLLIETRTDVALSTGRAVAVEHVGLIGVSRGGDETPAPHDSAAPAFDKPREALESLSAEHERALATVLRAQEQSRGSLLSILGNASVRRARALLDALEVLALFRKPVAYRIELAEELQYLPAGQEAPPETQLAY